MNEKPETVLRRLLDTLEPCIDLEHVARLRALNRAAVYYEPVERLSLVCYLPYESEDFTPYPYLEAFEDPAKMTVNQLLVGFGSVYEHITAPVYDDAPYCIRPNLGVGVIPSMFGAEIQIIDDNMPWAMPFKDIDDIRAIVDAPLPDVRAGLGQRILDQFDYFDYILAGYPNCWAAFETTLAGPQGPFSVAELMWGSRLYIDIYEHADLMKRLMDHIAKQIVKLYTVLNEKIRDSLAPDGGYQHGCGTRGRVLVRNDSIINISPAMYRDLVGRYDAQVSKAFGGVGFHVCGKFEHQIDNLLTVPEVECIDFGQPEMNDIDAIYAKAAPDQIVLARLQAPKDELTASQMKARFPRGVNLVYYAESVADGRATFARYIKGTE